MSVRTTSNKFSLNLNCIHSAKNMCSHSYSIILKKYVTAVVKIDLFYLALKTFLCVPNYRLRIIKEASCKLDHHFFQGYTKHSLYISFIFFCPLIFQFPPSQRNGTNYPWGFDASLCKRSREKVKERKKK